MNAHATTSTMIFIDSRVEHHDALLSQFPRDARITFLNASEDGLTQIAQAMEGQEELSAIHLIGHGWEGDIWLGSRYLSANNLDESGELLGKIGGHLSHSGDILVYGCNTAAGEQGLDFVTALARLTGADVAASNDRTGANGDWDLEIRSGTIETEALSPKDYSGDLATITVANDNNAGAGSLRQAIADADSGNTITLAGDLNIQLTSELVINKNITIDGDRNDDGTPDLTLDANYGSRVLSVASGTTVTLDGLVIREGLVSGNGGASQGNNPGGAGKGGGIYNQGSLTIINSILTHNLATGGGGAGVYATSGNPNIGAAGGGGGSGYNGIGGGNGGTGYNGLQAGVGGSGTGGGGSAYGHNGENGSAGGEGGREVNSSGAKVSGSGGSTTAGGAGGEAWVNSNPGGIGGDGGFVSISGGNGIGGGGGGSGIQSGPTLAGGAGGNAGGAIYNEGTLTITNSTLSNNAAAGGGGGGAGGLTLGLGGGGGHTAGGIFNAGTGTLNYNNTVSFINNKGTGGKDGGATTPGSAGASEPDVYNGGTVDSDWRPPNTPAAINGAVAGQSVNDTLTLAPFSGVTITDADSDIVTVTISLDTAAKGHFTSASLSASGFTDAGNGSYTLADRSAASAQTAIRALVYKPSENRVAKGTTETTTFTITVNDGTADTTNTTTTVVATPVNDAPTDISLDDATVKHSQGSSNVVVGSLSTTDADPGESFAYTLVSGAGDTDNSLFNISGSDLRANNPTAMAAGTYNIRVQTDDGDAQYGESFTITVTDDVAPTLTTVPSESPAANAESVDYTVTFSESVTGVSADDFELTTTGSATGNIASVSGSGTTYTVTVDTITGAGNLRLDLKGSTDISDGSLAPAAYTNGTAHTVDRAAPVVTSVSVPADGTYKAGDTLDFTVNFDDNITHTGTASTLGLTIGTSSVNAVYQSRTATSITYRYTVQANELDADGITVGSLSLVTDTIQDSNGNDATLTLNSVGSTSGVLVDAVPPGVPTGSLAVDENSADLTAVGTVTSTGATGFTLTDNAGGRFAIDNSGNVTVADGSRLDRETNAGHNITVRATDDAGNATTQILSVTVNDVNEIPDAVDKTFTVQKNTARTITGADLGFTDEDGDVLDHITLNQAPAAGTLWVDLDGNGNINGAESALSNGDTVSGADITAGKLKFRPATDAVGADYAAADFTVSDGTADADAANTWTFNVVSAPIIDLNGSAAGNNITGITYTENELDTPVSLVAADAAITDDDTNLVRVTMEITSGAQTGDEIKIGTRGTGDTVNGITITYNSDTKITLAGAASKANYTALLTELTFAQTGDDVGGADRTISVTGTDESSDTGLPSTITVSVTGINDAPSATHLTQTINLNEDAGATDISPVAFTVTDGDGDDEQLTATLTLSDAKAGILSSTSGGNFNSTTGVWTLTGSPTEIRTALNNTTFTPAENQDQNITISVNIADGGENGATAQTGTLSLNFTPAQDLPTSEDAARTIPHSSGAYTFTAEDFAFNDPDTGDSLDHVTIKTLPAQGSLTLDNVDVTPDQNIAAADIPKLKFTPAAGAGGADYASFTFTVHDGTGDSAAPNTITFSIQSAPAPAPDPDPDPTPGTLPDEDIWDSLPDDDGDGIPEAVEDFVPGLEGGARGDGNGDGVADKTQEEVTSLPFRNTDHISQNPDADQTFVTLAANPDSQSPGNTCTLDSVAQQDKPDEAPAGSLMPLGLIKFEANIQKTGSQESFSLFVDDSLFINGYWKQNSKGEWVNLASKEYGGSLVTENGKTRLDFKVTDGGEFDADGKADGVITDPGGAGYLSNETLFDETVYLHSKLAQLKAIGDDRFTTEAQVKAEMEAQGFTTFSHYRTYGLTEGTDPSLYFNTDEYLTAKVTQLNKTAYQGRTDWTKENTMEAFKACGFNNALDHFKVYGWKEDVNPSNQFDVSEYFKTKAAQIGLSVEEVIRIFDEDHYGLDPLTHYKNWGQNEDGVEISRVAPEEAASPVSISLQGVRTPALDTGDLFQG